MDIDKTDWKILNALLENSRLAMSAIARKARISKQSCFYRIKRLESEGLITGYRAKINSAKLGYSTYSVYLRLFNVTAEDEQELIKKILTIENVRWLVNSTGKWDMMFAVAARNNIEFDSILRTVLNMSHKHILDYETAIILSTKDIWLRKFEQQPAELIESATSDIEKIDETDKKILELLQENARMESTKISSLVGITAEAVSYRIKNLVKKGVIHLFTVNIDKEKLGLSWYQIQFLLSNQAQDDKSLISKLLMTEDVGYIVKTLGKWNFEIHIYCRNIEEFRTKLLRIRSQLAGNVMEYETNIILKKYKSKTLILN